MKPLDLDSVEVRGEPLTLSTHADVDDLERELGTTLPIGYRDYVTRLGWGTLNVLVRVLPPSEIRARLEEHRGLMAGFWFWADTPDGIDQDWGMGSIPIADTLDGDVLVVHPDEPTRIVILPRNLDGVFVRDAGLLEAIEWVCSGRVLRSFGPTRSFEPFAAIHETAPTRERAPKSGSNGVPSAPAAASARDHLLAYFAALRDAEEWFVEASGGPPAFDAPAPPMLTDAQMDDSVARFDAVHRRFCTEPLAAVLSGTAEGTWPPPHHPSNFEIRDEQTSKARVRIRVAESVAGVMWQSVEYLLEPDGVSWRIASRRVVE